MIPYLNYKIKLMCKIKGRGLVELVSSVLSLMVMVRGGTFHKNAQSS